jgi:hypothetical protein
VVIDASCSVELGTDLPTVHSSSQTSHAYWVLAQLP